MRNAFTACLAASALLFAPVVQAAKPKKDMGKDATIALPLKQIIPERQRLCTLKTASGLGYKLLRAAEGPTPDKRAMTKINYIGYLALDGNVFDQNVNVDMPVDGVIPGFAEGLRMAAKGSIIRLCIPAKLGYGERATGPIPANSDLIFQVEMLDIGA